MTVCIMLVWPRYFFSVCRDDGLLICDGGGTKRQTLIATAHSSVAVAAQVYTIAVVALLTLPQMHATTH